MRALSLLVINQLIKQVQSVQTATAEHSKKSYSLSSSFGIDLEHILDKVLSNSRKMAPEWMQTSEFKSAFFANLFVFIIIYLCILTMILMSYRKSGTTKAFKTVSQVLFDVWIFLLIYGLFCFFNLFTVNVMGALLLSIIITLLVYLDIKTIKKSLRGINEPVTTPPAKKPQLFITIVLLGTAKFVFIVLSMVYLSRTSGTESIPFFNSIFGFIRIFLIESFFVYENLGNMGCLFLILSSVLLSCNVYARIVIYTKLVRLKIKPANLSTSLGSTDGMRRLMDGKKEKMPGIADLNSNILIK